ncbi:MAG: hypothetical protein HOK65_04045 [Crocinitomicaceae bacterium]|nr:hypothetical protein [Crocinitomicaceae bacterium]
MIGKLIFSNGKSGQLTFSVAGSIIGLAIMLLSIQLYLDITTILRTPAISGTDFLVINKEVNMLADGNFNQSELENLKQQEFVIDAAPVFGNNFQSLVVAEVGPQSSFNTLMPLITVPNEFIDNLPPKFKWKIGDNEVPVIVPTSFFNSYNFGIAEAARSPKVTKELISHIKPKLKIGNATWYNVRIAAFSDRFSDGVIVPESFMNYNNDKFGIGEKNKINRIVISTSNSKNPSLANYLSDHLYETNSDKINGGKVTEIMNVLLPIIVIISLVIILLSLLTFIQNAQLLLSNSDYEIKLLGLIGYSFSFVSAAVMKNFNKLFGLITLSTIPIVIAVKYYISSIFNHELGIDIGIGLSWTTLVIGLCVYTCFYLVQFIIIRSTVKNLVRSS